MKFIKISISSSDIFAELAKTTAYSGAKGESDSSPRLLERVATADEDADLLRGYWDMACSSLVDRFRSFVSSADFSGGRLLMALETSGAYDDSLTPSLITDIFSFLTADIASRWFAITWPEKSESYSREAAALLLKAERTLYHRRRPVRKH